MIAMTEAEQMVPKFYFQGKEVTLVEILPGRFDTVEQMHSHPDFHDESGWKSDEFTNLSVVVVKDGQGVETRLLGLDNPALVVEPQGVEFCDSCEIGFATGTLVKRAEYGDEMVCPTCFDKAVDEYIDRTDPKNYIY